VVGCQNGWDSDAALRQSPELSDTGQLVHTPRRTPISGAATVDGSHRAYIYNTAAQHLRPLLGEDNPAVGRNGGMVSHMDLGRIRDSGMGCVRALDVYRLDQSSAGSAVLLEGPDNVNGLQWARTAADYSLGMGNSKSVVGQSHRVQCIPIGFHRQPQRADAVSFAPPNSVCRMPFQNVAMHNSRSNSRCGPSDVDSNGMWQSASQVTVTQPNVSTVLPNVVRAFSQNNVITVPVDVHRVSSLVNAECTGFPPARLASVGTGIEVGQPGVVLTGPVHQFAVTEFDPFFSRTIQRPRDASNLQPIMSGDPPDCRRFVSTAVGRSMSQLVGRDDCDPFNGCQHPT